MSLCPSCNADAGDVAKFCPACGAAVVRVQGGDDYAGRIIAGKFRVEKLIGEGGMGKVYKATQMSLDKSVVLKVLRQSLLSDERTVARFQREAKAASRLNHPNSISVIDFGQDEEGALYIAMEFVSGQDLHQVLTAAGPLPEHRMVRILGQVLSALSDAHAAGVIHRDLKPENIMVEQRRGEPDFVKVLDFGIAKIQDAAEEGGPALTRAGFVCGTPEYMSPEQARGGQLDARSDLYAVGVILYQCATGVLPFESDSAVGLATMHLTQDPVPPRQRNPHSHIGEALERLILKAMSKNPRERPQSAEEFRAALLHLDGDVESTQVDAQRTAVQSGVAGKPGRPAQKAPEPGKQERTPTWSTSPGGDYEPTTTSVRPKGRSAALMAGLGLGGVLLLGLGAFAAWQFMGGKGPAVAAEIPDPIPSKQPASDVNLAQETPPAPRREPAKARDLMLQGDGMLTAGRYDEAAAAYAKSFEADPGTAPSRKAALASLLQGDGPATQKWLREYLQTAKDPADREAIERYLNARN